MFTTYPKPLSRKPVAGFHCEIVLPPWSTNKRLQKTSKRIQPGKSNGLMLPRGHKNPVKQNKFFDVKEKKNEHMSQRCCSSRILELSELLQFCELVLAISR